VISIGNSPFRYCSSLTSIDVTEGSTHYVSENGILFNHDKTLLINYPVANDRTSYTIPDSVESIGGSAFFGCTNLESVYYQGPYDVSSELLKYLKQRICNANGLKPEGLIDAVITVPAKFGYKERKETKKAAQLAGINVLRLLNEPTAAAIAFAFADNSMKLDANNNILVFDLGGGTFDCTILNVRNIDGVPNYKVLASCGNAHLGGVDIDNAICQFVFRKLQCEDSEEIDEDLVNIYKKAFKGKNAKTNQSNLCKLKARAEQAKIDYNTHNHVGAVKLDGIYEDENGESMEIPIEDDFWDETIKGIAERSRETIERTLKEAKLKKEEINRVIMIGGSCQIKEVGQVLEDFGVNNICSSEAVGKQLAVTFGGALEAFRIKHNAVGDNGKPLYKIIETCPFGLDIEVVVDGGKLITSLIKSNDEIPKTEQFLIKTTDDNQVSFAFILYEEDKKEYGDFGAVPQDKKPISRFELCGLPKRPKNEVTALFTMVYQEDYIVKINVKVIEPKGYEHISVDKEIDVM